MAKVKYFCKKCNYKFSRDENISFKQCPYCGAAGSVEVDTQNTAKKLIDEVSKIDRMRQR
ncbi:MAG: hypothetical protein V1859_11450 [archaeon]